MIVDKKLLENMVSNGRAQDLHDLLMGTSKYNDPTISSTEGNEVDHKLWTLAIHYLEFVSKHGKDKDEVWIGDRYETSNRDQFEAWIEAGAPGLIAVELEAYLNENPLD